MLHDTLVLASRLAADGRELWLDHARPAVELPTAGITRHIQSGADLGERMHKALTQTLQTADAAILIGTDCPEYDVGYLQSAFEALQHHDAVIGPADDGGYVLIGLKRAEARLFQDIAWGGDRVLADTRERLAGLGWHWHELPPLHDVDEPDDLLRFPELLDVARQMPPAE